jgi:soluble cytochrome b562
MEIFKLFGSIFIDNEEANKSISKTEEKAEGLASKLGSGIKTAAKWGAGIAAAGTAAGAALLAVANKAAQTTDRIDKMSQKIGISREGFQEWDFILSQSGTDVEKLQMGFKTLVTQIDQADQGVGKGARNFAALGVQVRDVNGNLRSQEDIFNDVLVALQNMEDGTEKARLANELLGRSGSELMPLLNAEAGSIEALRQQAHELGLVISDEAVDAGVLFTDTMDQLKRAFGAVFTQVGTALMPIFQKLAQWLIDNMPQIQETVSKVFGVIGNVIGGVVGVIGTVIDAIEAVVKAAKTAWDWLKKVFGGGGRTTTYTPAPTSTPDMPALADGGDILRSGWALVGERGPELAYLPTGAQVRPLSSDNVTINQTINVTGPVDSDTIRELDATLGRRNDELVRRLKLAHPGVVW